MACKKHITPRFVYAKNTTKSTSIKKMESKHISKEKIHLIIIKKVHGQWNLLAWFCVVPLSLLHIVLQHVIFNFTLSFMVDQGVPLEHQKFRSPFNYATHLALYIVRCSILNQRSLCPTLPLPNWALQHTLFEICECGCNLP